MVPAEYYRHIYLALVAIMTIGICLLRVYDKRNLATSLILTLLIIAFIGLRPLSGQFIDMMNYHSYFIFLDSNLVNYTLSTQNVIFDNIFILFSNNSWPEQYFYLVISAIYFGCALWACIKLFPNKVLTPLVVILGAFSTFAYGVNGIKAGAAASIFLLAIAYREKLWLSLLLAIISYGFHHSMIMVIGAYIMCLFIKNANVAFAFWVFCLFIATFHITLFQEAFSFFVDEHSGNYLLADSSSEGAYLTGFRLDFILYSFMPILIYLILNYNYEIQSNTYSFIFNLYTITNGLWLLCMYASYTNRIAYLSWFMLPIALVYPFLKLDGIRNNDLFLILIVLAHLGFTVFMNYVYYG